MPESPFPPSDLTSFLRLCAGEWLALRSSLALAAVDGAETGTEGDGTGTAANPEGEEPENWHRSERGELHIAFLDPLEDDEAGGLEIRPPERPSRRLRFRHGGAFGSEEGQGAQALAGVWHLWPDGSLELCTRQGDREIRERLWFTQPNLRLRSSVERGADGRPGRASFSSEIRRLRRPPTA